MCILQGQALKNAGKIHFNDVPRLTNTICACIMQGLRYPALHDNQFRAVYLVEWAFA